MVRRLSVSCCRATGAVMAIRSLQALPPKMQPTLRAARMKGGDGLRASCEGSAMSDLAPSARPSLRSRLAVLRRPGFALLFAATSVSTLGSAVASIVLTFALLAKGYSASAVGVVVAAQTAPMVVLLLAGGVAGDRWPRRSIMVGADLLRFASQGVLAILLLRGHPSLAALMTLAGLCGVGNAFYGPAESGLVPQAAGPEHIKAANSLISLTSSLIGVIGPSLGGLLVMLGGAALAIGLDAASYALSAGLLSLMPTLGHGQPAAARASFVADLRQGWGEFSRHRWLRLITVQFGLLNLLTFPSFIVLGAASFAPVPGGLQMWGLVISASGAGGVAGGLLLLRWTPPRPLVIVELAVVLAALPVALLALRAPVAVIAVGGAMLGMAGATLNVLILTAIQDSVPDAVLSRVNSLVILVAQGLAPIGFAACGPAAQLVGVRRALGGGALILLVSAVVMLGVQDIRRYRSPHRQAT